MALVPLMFPSRRDVVRSAPDPASIRWSTHVKGCHVNRIEFSGSSTGVSGGTPVSAPLWILLPVLTPACIIVATLALHHLETSFLVSNQEAEADAGIVDDHRAYWVHSGR